MNTPPFHHFKDFTAEQLMKEDQFIQYVLYPTAESEAYWNSFSTTYPDKKKVLEEAKEALKNFDFKFSAPPEKAKERVWNRLQASIQNEKLQKRISFPVYWKAIAAVLIAGLFIGGYFLWNATKYQTVKTAFGEIKTIELPDHSEIILNANSSIRYKKEWAKEETRTVKIDGEAFFKVKREAQKVRPFYVVSKNTKVQVLGTSFNVNNRHQQTTIVLKDGKVKLITDQQAQKYFIIHPGEKVVVTTGEKVQKSKVALPQYISWKDKKWEFEHTPLSQIIQQLNDNYGIKIQLADPELKTKTLSGTLSTENKAVLLKGIATVLDVEIEHINKTTFLIKEKK